MVDREVTECPVCGGSLGKPAEYIFERDVYQVSCDRCGWFRVSKELSEDRLPRLSERERACLSGIIRAATDRVGRFAETLTHDNIDRVLTSSGAPTSVDEQIDGLLHAVARAEEFFGRTTGDQPVEPWIARAFLPDELTLVELANELARSGLVTCQQPRPHRVTLSLRMPGWQRLRERQQRGVSKRVFIARWFCTEMEEIHDAAIDPAIREVGLDPYCVNRESFTDPIDDTIIAAIRGSRAVIVDVTGERPSVYFEAGFARALDIPVIWCCNASWKTRLPAGIEAQSEAELETELAYWKVRLHFDTRQFPHIMWETADDLREALMKRLCALDLHEREPRAERRDG